MFVNQHRGVRSPVYIKSDISFSSHVQDLLPKGHCLKRTSAWFPPLIHGVSFLFFSPGGIRQRALLPVSPRYQHADPASAPGPLFGWTMLYLVDPWWLVFLFLFLFICHYKSCATNTNRDFSRPLQVYPQGTFPPVGALVQEHFIICQLLLLKASASSLIQCLQMSRVHIFAVLA